MSASGSNDVGGFTLLVDHRDASSSLSSRRVSSRKRVALGDVSNKHAVATKASRTDCHDAAACAIGPATSPPLEVVTPCGKGDVVIAAGGGADVKAVAVTAAPQPPLVVLGDLDCVSDHYSYMRAMEVSDWGVACGAVHAGVVVTAARTKCNHVPRPCDVWLSQTALRPASKFLSTVQSDITPTMRAILVDWLVEVAEEYHLHPETLYVCVRIMRCIAIAKYITAHGYRPATRRGLAMLTVWHVQNDADWCV